MVKGVNRQIVEINETDCDYFERVIFIVRPEHRDTSHRELESQADFFYRQAAQVPQKKSRLLPAIKLLSAAGIGAAAMAVLSNL